MSKDRSSLRLFDLAGRTALVTGGGRGIGHAMAEGLARAGAHVVINGRNVERLEEVVGQWRSDGLQASSVAFDVTDPAAVRNGVELVESRIGPVDILINNAGIQHRQSLELFEDEDWRRILEANLSSAFYVAKAVARVMIPRRRGKIINICSVQSELGRPSIAPYAATKGGLKMLTKGMAVDWGKHGICANAIGPGYFKTDLNAALVKDKQFSDWLINRTPMKRWGEVGELVGAAVFLSSEASSFVNGQVLYVDGGVTSAL
jgi:gluconate 5-dehydrogenase